MNRIFPTAVLLLTATAQPFIAAHAQSVTGGPAIPIHGTIRGQEQYEFDLAGFPPLMLVRSSGTGTGTLLGRFAMSAALTVNLVTLEATGSVEITAAGGDRLFAEVTGHAEPDLTGAPDHFLVVEDLAIGGGTGRFKDAAGALHLEREVNTATGTTAGLFDGALVLGQPDRPAGPKDSTENPPVAPDPSTGVNR